MLAPVTPLGGFAHTLVRRYENGDVLYRAQ